MRNSNWPQDILFLDYSNEVLISNLGNGGINQLDGMLRVSLCEDHSALCKRKHSFLHSFPDFIEEINYELAIFFTALIISLRLFFLAIARIATIKK